MSISVPTIQFWAAIVPSSPIGSGTLTAMSNMRVAVVESPSVAVYVNSAFVNAAVVVPAMVRAVASNVSPVGNVGDRL